MHHLLKSRAWLHLDSYFWGRRKKSPTGRGGGGKGEGKDDGELQAGEQDEKDRRGQKGTCVMAPTWSVPKRTCST